MNDILAALHDRKSVRAFLDEPISDDDKNAILLAACAAPTAGNQQLYTILDITDQKLKDALSVSCDNQPFIARAPMVLIFCADCKKWYDAYREAGLTHRELLGLPEHVVPCVMLVFGHPTEQQKQRQKPARFELCHIVHENRYRPMDGAELREMFAPRAGNGYDAWMEAFWKRKYESAFSREMTRSVEKYLEQFGAENKGPPIR